jgi:hypothetical protein
VTPDDPRAGLAESPRHGTPARYQRGPDEHGQPGKGCRCTPCREANTAYSGRRSRLIAYGRWQYQLDAAGTRRRLQALIWNGWSAAALAARYGCTRRAVRKMLAYERVSPATAAKVRALCAGLQYQPPPQGTPHERRAVTMARRYAREHGFAPIGAWDDEPGPHFIDDPAAVPVPGAERGERRERGALYDEAVELLGFGLDLNQAAERLGVEKSTLSTTLSRERAKDAAREEADRAAA